MKASGFQQRKSKKQQAKRDILDSYNGRLEKTAWWMETYKDCSAEAASKTVEKIDNRAAAK